MAQYTDCAGLTRGADGVKMMLSPTQPAGKVVQMLKLYENASIIVLLQDSRSHNRKTGDTCNLWVQSKGVASLACGDCPSLPRSQGGTASGKTSCYAWRGKPGLIVGKLRGAPIATTAELRAAIRGRTIRSAVIGDLGMVPTDSFTSICARLVSAGAAGVIGYTHQWRAAEHMRQTHMASADSLADAQAAWSAGWRTFRVLDKATPAWRGRNEHGEIACPAWATNGKTLCADCRMCDGANGKPSVAIAAH